MATYSNSFDPVGIADGHSPVTSYTPSDYDRDLAAHIHALYEQSSDATMEDRDFWEIARRFLKGDQLLYRNTMTGEYVRVKDSKQKKRLYSINNQLRPTHRSLVGKLGRLIPSFSCVPSTASQAQIATGRVGDVFFEYFRRHHKMNTKYLQICDAVGTFGTGCWQLAWDPLGGRELAYCQECHATDTREMIGQNCWQCAQMLAQAQLQHGHAAIIEAKAGMEPAPPPETPPLPTMVQIFEGEEVCRVHDMRNVFFDPLVTDPQDLRYVIVRYLEPLSEIRRQFPDLGQHVAADGNIYMDRTVSRTYATDTGMWYSSALTDYAYRYEYHEKPTETYPDGRIVNMTSGLILEEKPGYYRKFKRLPFFFNWWERNQGEFLGEGFMRQAWMRQKELNELETQIREYTELLVKIKLLVPIGSRLTSDEITATSGQIINYNKAAGGIDHLVPPPMPAEVFSRREMLMSDIRYGAGITNSDAGLMASDPNGRAMAIVQAESDQQIGPIVTRNIEEWAEFYRCALIMVQEFRSPDWKFTVSGDEGMGVYSFQGAKLEEGFDLQLDVEDGLSQNKAIRLQQNMDLANIGVFGDQQAGSFDVQRFAKSARLKMPGMGLDVVSPEYAAAQAMIMQIEQGHVEAAQPMPYDDPVIFQSVFLNWLRTHRDDPNQQLKAQVQQMWQFYTAWAMSPQQQPPGYNPVAALQGTQQPQGQASQAGTDQSAPGGSANNAGHVGTNQASGQNPGPQPGQSGVLQQAAAMTHQVDTQNERLSKTQQQHEH